MISSQELNCILPPYQYTSITQLSVTVTLNSIETYGDLTLTLYPEIYITSISPNKASEYTEDLFIYVNTEGKFIDGVNLNCFIGEYKALVTIYESPTQIKCLVPKLKSGVYPIIVTNNGFNIVKSEEITLTISSLPVVVWIQPEIISKASSLILVGGFNFHSGVDYKCFFEPHDPDTVITEDFITPGIYISKEVIICHTPNFHSVQDLSSFSVRVANFNNEWSVKGPILTIRQSNPLGKHFFHNEVSDCPKGTYCGSLDALAPRLCPAGYYQSYLGQKNCTICPLGYICPFVGMSEPYKCPGSHVCDEPGLSWPRKNCPSGHFCYPGTLSDFAVGVNNLDPVPCEAGTYCLERSITGVVLRNTPQAANVCKRGFVCPRGSGEATGIGACPTGFYCPTSSHAGIPCPPRYYCPNYGTVTPLICPAGTFNAEFGQRNCSKCPMGYICPISGMLTPMKCPRGYICNKEGLVHADEVCTGGYICTGGVKSGSVDKLCSIIRNLDTVKTDCEYGVIVTGSDVDIVIEFDESFRNTVYLCCWNTSAMAKMVRDVGIYFGEDNKTSPAPPFTRYSSYFLDSNIDGIKVIKWITGNLKLSDYGFYIPEVNARKIRFVFWSMHRNPKQLICPGGKFCLPGTTTEGNQSALSLVPRDCPAGTYCREGSSSAIGSGYCPVGFYCPSASEIPIETQPGYFTPRPGAVEPKRCRIGHYTMRAQSTSCLKCPAGYECRTTGTLWPNICKRGTYRSVGVSDVCHQCPEGTWMPLRGSDSILQCFNCPPGMICSKPRSPSLSTAALCTDGYICGDRSTNNNMIACPEGFYCPKGTTPSSYYNNMCPAGFYCPQGTANSSKYFNVCPQGYFCPNGSYFYEEFINTNTKTAQCFTKCPDGTGLSGTEGKQNLLECAIESSYTLLNTEISNRRILQAETITTESDTSQLSLYEIEYALWNYKRSNGEIRSTYINSINTKRNYLRLWNPIDFSISQPPNQFHESTIKESDTLLHIGIFTTTEMSLILVTMDLRHLYINNSRFVYGYDWGISITINDITENNDAIRPVLLPEILLNENTTKASEINLAIQSYAELKIRIDILLYSGYLLSHKLLFANTTSIYTAQGNRTLYGRHETFAIVLDNSLSIALPMNLLIIDSYSNYPKYQVNYAYNSNETVRHKGVSGRTVFVPSSLYWRKSQQVSLPYLPYFSNCQGYGEAIHLWQLFELSSACNLVPYNEIVPISQYSFGSYPHADTCRDIIINCIYDEIFVDMQPDPRWFEVEGGTVLMYVSKDPLSAKALASGRLADTKLIPVTIASTQAGGRVVPAIVHLKFMYFQKDKDTKSLVKVTIEFNQYQSLNDEEYTGITPVNYKLIIDYLPMSHKELMISFALDIQFYIILYILVGFAAVVIVAIFTLYHRLTTNATEVPQFKFFSYLKFNIAPAIGIPMALLPIAIVIIVIKIVISGHLATVDIGTGKCDSADLSSCKTTILDNIPVCLLLLYSKIMMIRVLITVL